MLGDPVDIPIAVSFIIRAFMHILDLFASLIMPHRQPAGLKEMLSQGKNEAVEVENESCSFACLLGADIWMSELLGLRFSVESWRDKEG